jgi:hypothetical protein
MENIMDVVYVMNRRSCVNTMGKLYICQETKRENQINHKNTSVQNRLFDIITSVTTIRVVYVGR